VLALIAVADWLALKTRAFSHPPWILAALATGVGLLLLVDLGLNVRKVRARRDRKATAWGQILFLSGILVMLGSGMANWVLALQGFVILTEGEAVPGSHLQELEAGPLSSIEEMDLVLMLEELELIPAGEESFYSRPGDETTIRLSPQESGTVGSLRFFQGAFGFAPRIVITEGDYTVFDRLVPFTTERRGPTGVLFLGHFTVGEKSLDVRGSVNLPEGIRGHATLDLVVSREGRVLGRGALLPGHFAELSEGYRVGFAGLKKWSEIDVSRIHYGPVVMVGALLALAGALFWLLAGWRDW
jgi:hypothetical protein